MNRTTLSFIHQDETAGLARALSTASFQRVLFQLSAFSVLEEEDQVPVPKDPRHVSAAKLFMAHSVVYIEAQRCRLRTKAQHDGSPFPGVGGLRRAVREGGAVRAKRSPRAEMDATLASRWLKGC